LVRVSDPARHAVRALADVKVPALARYADDERAIVVYRGNQLTLVDTHSGVQREMATPTPIVQLAVSGPIVFWNDAAGALWRLDVVRGEPEKVGAVTEPVHALAPSSDGRWIALAGADHVLALD